MTCKYCERTFPAGFEYPEQQLCSMLCRYRFQQETKAALLSKVCEECEQPYKATKYKQRFCSKECRYINTNRRLQIEWHATHPKLDSYPYVCTRCNVDFELPHKLSGAAVMHGVFCLDCRPKVRQARYHVKTVKRQSKTLPNRISHADLAERDGLDCHICKTPIDMDIPKTSRYGATIDHVIPLSKGGTDEPDNLKLAHWICNNQKSNKVGN